MQLSNIQQEKNDTSSFRSVSITLLASISFCNTIFFAWLWYCYSILIVAYYQKHNTLSWYMTFFFFQERESAEPEIQSIAQSVSSQLTSDTQYAVRAIDFMGRTTHIIYQEKNGPCPLIAICKRKWLYF